MLRGRRWRSVRLPRDRHVSRTGGTVRNPDLGQPWRGRDQGRDAGDHAEVLESAQVAANGSFLADTDVDGITTLFPKLPFRMSPDDGPPSRPAPRVGDATVPILRELGLDEAELAELLDAKIVTGPRKPVS
jgi:hypothetical protein